MFSLISQPFSGTPEPENGGGGTFFKVLTGAAILAAIVIMYLDYKERKEAAEKKRALTNSK